MIYYRINKELLTIISGPHTEKSTAIKRLTACGNPELLDLSAYDLVPEVIPVLLADQVHTEERVVSLTAVTWGVRDKTTEELAIEAENATALAILTSETNSARLLFRLCKTLINSGVVNPNDPNMAEITTAYLEWQALKGI